MKTLNALSSLCTSLLVAARYNALLNDGDKKKSPADVVIDGVQFKTNNNTVRLPFGSVGNEIIAALDAGEKVSADDLRTLAYALVTFAHSGIAGEHDAIHKAATKVKERSSGLTLVGKSLGFVATIKYVVSATKDKIVSPAIIQQVDNPPTMAEQAEAATRFQSQS